MPKIIAFAATFIINIAAGIVVFFFMLLAMNGFGESDANYGLVTYIFLAVIISALMAGGSAPTAHLLTKRKFRGWASVMISVPIFSIVGIGLKIGSSVVGVLVADYVRVNY